MRRRYAALASILLLATACSGGAGSAAEQAKSGDNKGYVAGDGTIVLVSPDQRGTPVTLSGSTLDGGTWSVADAAGTVVVMNVWGSWCPPCVAEIGDIEAAYVELKDAGKQVTFMGINVRESAETGAAFAASKGVTYPSLSDKNSVLVLDLQGKVVGYPTTVVLDPTGRIAGVITGPTSTSTLTGLVDDVLAS